MILKLLAKKDRWVEEQQKPSSDGEYSKPKDAGTGDTGIVASGEIELRAAAEFNHPQAFPGDQACTFLAGADNSACDQPGDLFYQHFIRL